MTLEYTGLRQASALFGRVDELDALRRFVEALPGAGSALLLVGEPGIGKTRLLGAARDLALDAGLRVLTAEGVSTETAIPYASLHQLLLPVLGRLPALGESQRSSLASALGFDAGPAPEPLVVYNAVLSFLSIVAGERPVLLLVDDLQGVDPSTASVLSFLAHRLDGTSIGLLCASTPREGCAPVVGPQLHLARLSRTESERLLASAEPALPHRARVAVLRQADGNPLALLELLREVRGTLDRGLGGLPAVVPTSRAARFPFLRSVENLPERTTRALLLLALDHHGDVGALAAASLAIDDLAPAERGGVITVDMQTLTARFDHPLLRSTVVARASSGERRLAHLTLAARAGMGLEERAHHLAEATADADEATAALLEGAAHEALTRGDSSAATQALARAARLSPEPRDRRRRLARAAYVAVDLPGEHGLDPRLLGEVRLTGGGAASMYAAVAAAHAQLETGGDGPAACRMIREAVEAGDHGWDAGDTELVDALGAWLLMCCITGGERQWEAYLRALGRLRPRPPEPLRTLSAAVADAVRAGGAHRKRMIELLSGLGGAESGHVLLAGTAATFFDLLGMVRPEAARLIESGRAGGSTLTHLRSIGLVALHDVGAGRWAEARALIEEGLAGAASAPSQPLLASFYYLAALLAGARGDSDESLDWSRRLDGLGVRLDAVGLRHLGRHARVVRASGQARWEEVYREASAVSPAGTFAPFAPQALWVAYDLVEAAVRTGRPDEARAHHTAMVAAGLPALSPRLAMLTHAAGAIVTGSAGWRDHYERALAVPHAGDWPFEHARVQLAYGARLRRERHPSEARDQLHRALATFERLGAAPWAATTRNELRAAHEHVDAGEGLVPLTAQELAVAELAAGGFSNKQIGQRLFLSSRTVSGHLYRVFPKLGIASRSALRDALVGRAATE